MICSYLHLTCPFTSLFHFHQPQPPSPVSLPFNLVCKQSRHQHLLLDPQPTSFLPFESLFQPLRLALPTTVEDLAPYDVFLLNCKQLHPAALITFVFALFIFDSTDLPTLRSSGCLADSINLFNQSLIPATKRSARPVVARASSQRPQLLSPLEASRRPQDLSSQPSNQLLVRLNLLEIPKSSSVAWYAPVFSPHLFDLRTDSLTATRCQRKPDQGMLMKRLSTLEPCRLPSSPAMFKLFQPPLNQSRGHWGASEEDDVARWKDYVQEGESISNDVINHAGNAGYINGRHLNAQFSNRLINSRLAARDYRSPTILRYSSFRLATV